MTDNVQQTEAALAEVKAVGKRVRKALTDEQRKAKQAADRARRSAKKTTVRKVAKKAVVAVEDTCPHCSKPIIHSKKERRPRKICKKKTCQQAAAAAASARYRARLKKEGGSVKVKRQQAARVAKPVMRKRTQPKAKRAAK